MRNDDSGIRTGKMRSVSQELTQVWFRWGVRGHAAGNLKLDPESQTYTKFQKIGDAIRIPIGSILGQILTQITLIFFQNFFNLKMDPFVYKFCIK